MTRADKFEDSFFELVKSWNIRYIDKVILINHKHTHNSEIIEINDYVSRDLFEKKIKKAFSFESIYIQGTDGTFTSRYVIFSDTIDGELEFITQPHVEAIVFNGVRISIEDVFKALNDRSDIVLKTLKYTEVVTFESGVQESKDREMSCSEDTLVLMSEVRDLFMGLSLPNKLGEEVITTYEHIYTAVWRGRDIEVHAILDTQNSTAEVFILDEEGEQLYVKVYEDDSDFTEYSDLKINFFDLNTES